MWSYFKSLFVIYIIYIWGSVIKCEIKYSILDEWKLFFKIYFESYKIFKF